MPLLGVIADDFTGATDIANTLVKGGMRTVQTIGVPAADLDLSAIDAVVVALKSRSIAAEIAVPSRISGPADRAEMVAAWRGQPDGESAQHRRRQSEQATEIAAPSAAEAAGPGLVSGKTGLLSPSIHGGPGRSEHALICRSQARPPAPAWQ